MLDERLTESQSFSPKLKTIVIKKYVQSHFMSMEIPGEKLKVELNSRSVHTVLKKKSGTHKYDLK